MASFRLRTLGRIKLEDSRGLPIEGVRRTDLALLAFVARRARKRIPRDELAAVFWGERQEARARQSLRQVLFRLRAVLGADIEVTAEAVALADSSMALDATEFEAHVAAGHFAAAAACYQGEFLRGADDVGGELFRGWLEAERAGLARQLTWTFTRLADAAQSRGDWIEAGRTAERWAAEFPLAEAPVLRLFTALQRQDRLAEALALRDGFIVRFRQAMAMDPSAEILAAGESAFRRESAMLRPTSAALLAPDLVGRDAPLAALDALWHGISERSAAVLLEGEPGIGKTRLAREFARRVSSTPHRAVLLTVRPESDREDAPLAAARRLLTPLRHAPGLSGASDRALAQLSLLLPSLRERFPRLPEPDTHNDRFDEALAEVLAAVGQETPVLIVADDFPRLDAPTRELLLALMRNPPRALLILLAARSDELRAVGRWHDIDESPFVARLKLQPLDAKHTEALVSSMIELTSEAQLHELARRIHAESGGLPFYAVELVSTLADAGILALDPGGRWQLTTSLGGTLLPLPASVDGAVQRRLELLSPAARATLEAAAVIGRRADARILESVAGLPPDGLATATSELVARRLLNSYSEPTPGYEFSHELIRRAAYVQMPATLRRTLHAKTLAVLEQLNTYEPATHELAYHRKQSAKFTLGKHPQRWRSRLAGTAVAVALAVVPFGIVTWRSLGVPAMGSQPRLVVAPFENLTADSEVGPLSRIAADWISQAIARAGLVKVTPSAEVPLNGAAETKNVLERARDAHADLVVRGSYQRRGDSLRIVAELLDVRTGRVLGVAGPLAATTRDPMSAIDELSERLMGTLSAWVDPRIAAAAAVQSNPPNYQAYRAFAEGLDYLYARSGERALPNFLRAYALDTTYTLPLLYAAIVYEGHANFSALDSVTRILLPRRGELAPYDRAILDYEVALGQRDWARMFVAAEQAADIAPGSLLAVYHLPRTAIALNRPRRAVELLEAVDPERGAARGLTGYWSLLSAALHMVGDYEGQLAVALEVRRRFPQEYRALYYQARALAALGRLRELDNVLEESWLLTSISGFGPPGFDLHGVVAQELNAHGYPEHARLVFERQIRFHDAAAADLMDTPRHTFEVGRALYHLDRLDEAGAVFESLQDDSLMQLAAWGYLGFIAVLQSDSARVTQVEDWLRRHAARSVGPTSVIPLEYLARMAALQGEPEQAVRLLRQMTAAGRSYDSGFHVYWEFARLRGYRPFEEWLRPKG
jgi:DNA-binding SARP family transcriptional activator/TolB-like protein